MKLDTAQGPALVLRTFDGVRELRTQRTLLRQWKDSDLDPWVAMNADPEVRRHFTGVQTRDEALGEAGRIRAALEQRGWGAWALEIPGVMPFAGFVGLIVPTWSAHFTPAVEIGWRLPRAAWGQGYASEAAAAAAAFALDVLQLPELVAITIPANDPSRRVMKRIGMVHDAGGDFAHPRIAADHAMSRHVLYRLPGRIRSATDLGGHPPQSPPPHAETPTR